MIEVFLNNEEATNQLGQDLALALTIGDCVALSGDLGAGKTTLARALIRAIAVDPLYEVPSPTFTLIQYYNLRIPIAHCDLYRLSGSDEMAELGLDELLQDGIALIEWPENAGEGELPNSIIVSFSDHQDGRLVKISGPDTSIARIKHTLEIRKFINATEFKNATRQFFVGDASARSYELLNCENGTNAILVDSPDKQDQHIISDGKTYMQLAHLADNIYPFIAIGNYLQSCGFSAPKILAEDGKKGLLIIENLGRGRVLNDQDKPIIDRYKCAVEVLSILHQNEPVFEIELSSENTYCIPQYSDNALLSEVTLLLDWYAEFKLRRPLANTARQSYIDIWKTLFSTLDGCERSLVLRDYHSPNLIWCDERSGTDKIGLIDFQDAVIGPSSYDLASLIQDARITVSKESGVQLFSDYCEFRQQGNRSFNKGEFEQQYAIMAAQRACKILGIFVRLKTRDKKPGYIRHLPRIEDYLKQTIQNPHLHELQNWFLNNDLIKAD